MISDNIEMTIQGTGSSQIAEVTLDPGLSVIAAPGAMTFMDTGVSMQAKFGDKSRARRLFSGLLSSAKKVATKSKLTVVHFENKAGVAQRVGFSSDLPGQLVQVDFGQWPEGLILQKNSFLFAAYGTKIDASLTNVSAGSFGGGGFVLQRMSGDGMGVFSAGGSVVRKDIENSSLVVETRSIAAYSASLSYGVERTGGLGAMMLAGEGIFNSTLSGTGSVFIQSLPMQKLSRALEGTNGKSK